MPERDGSLLGRTRWSLWCHRSLRTDDPVGKTVCPLKMLFGHSKPDIEKLPSKMPKKRTESKLRGERFDHIGGLFKILKDVEKTNPWILSDGDRVWNMDDTTISCELGQRAKGFGSSQTHHGGFVSSSLDSIGLALTKLESPSKW